MEGFDVFEFEAEGDKKPVYRRGTGPAVVLMHELPGMGLPTIDLARRIADEGFSVYMPLLFGKPGESYGMRPILWPCIWKEFNLLRDHGESPAANWLRALSRKAYADCGGKGVGAIGMCLTGGFALSLMLDKELIAPVLAQPSMPIWPWSGALGVSQEAWETAKRRSKEEDIPVLAFRFEGDRLCPNSRFETLRDAFGDRFHGLELPGDKHSVLTYHFKDLSDSQRSKVWNTLVSFLSSRLK